MAQLFNISLELDEFNKALAKYLLLNKRETSGLVEHSARKVVTGFSPRSASAKKVKGLRQFFYEKRATTQKIKSEFRAREQAGRGTLRPPFHYVSKRARSQVKYRSKKAAINWRTRRGKAWLQATMLYPNWRPSPEPKSKVVSPKPRMHKGARPNTRVIIKTNNKHPYVIWKSSVPGVVKGKYLNRAIARALRDGKEDMLVYVNRKINSIKL